MSTPEPLFAAERSVWTPVNNPATAGFGVKGLPDDWSSTGVIRIDGVPAVAWMAAPPIGASRFTANALLSAWTARVDSGVRQNLSKDLGTPEFDDDSLVVMTQPVVLADRPDIYLQKTEGVIQSPFGPLSSWVFHGIRRNGNAATMARLSVTAMRTDAFVIERAELVGS